MSAVGLYFSLGVLTSFLKLNFVPRGIIGSKVGGKTGTAQNPHGEDHAWFVSFAPAEDPEIAITSLVENGGQGGAVAAPIARRVMKRYFELKEQDTRLNTKVATLEAHRDDVETGAR